MTVHVIKPTWAEILPHGKDPMTLAREAAARRKAVFAPRPDPAPVIVSRPYAPRPILEIIGDTQPKPKAEPKAAKPKKAPPTSPAPPYVKWDHSMQRKCITIMRAVCAASGFTRDDICSERRTKDVTRARHVFFYLCKMLTPSSFPAIGNECGGRDHTTAIHGFQRVDASMKRAGLTIHSYMAPIDAARLVLNADWREPTKAKNPWENVTL